MGWLARLVGGLWCRIMGWLEGRDAVCSVAYEVAVTECWFVGVLGFRPRLRSILDLLRLPLLLGKRVRVGRCGGER